MAWDFHTDRDAEPVAGGRLVLDVARLLAVEPHLVEEFLADVLRVAVVNHERGADGRLVVVLHAQALARTRELEGSQVVLPRLRRRVERHGAVGGRDGGGDRGGREAEDGDGRRGELALLRARLVEERGLFGDRAEGGHGLLWSCCRSCALRWCFVLRRRRVVASKTSSYKFESFGLSRRASIGGVTTRGLLHEALADALSLGFARQPVARLPKRPPRATRRAFFASLRYR